MVEFDTGVAWASLQIATIHLRVAPESEIHWLMATIRNTGWMNHCQVRHECIEAIPILDPVDVEETYDHIASSYHSLQWHVQSYGWRHASVS